MTSISMETIELLEMLPEDEQRFAFEFIKKLVRAWDPDYTKLTPSENKRLEEAKQGEFISAAAIDFDNMDNLDLD